MQFQDVQKYFDKAKCFVNSSEFEGFPNTFIQACLGSTPILSFNVNPDNFIERFEVGCFCANSLDKAVEFIRNLDPEKIRFYGNNAFKYACKHHNIEDKIRYRSFNKEKTYNCTPFWEISAFINDEWQLLDSINGTQVFKVEKN